MGLKVGVIARGSVEDPHARISDACRGVLSCGLWRWTECTKGSLPTYGRSDANGFATLGPTPTLLLRTMSSGHDLFAVSTRLIYLPVPVMARLHLFKPCAHELPVLCDR